MKHSIIILFLFSIIFQTTIYAQNSDEVLVLTKKGNNKKKIIKQGKKIKVWVRKYEVPEKHKGRLTIINNETIQVDGETIKISEISQIKGPSIANQITGSVLLLSGTAAVGLGTAIIIWAINSNNPFAIIFGIIIGIPLMAGGIVIDSTGFVFLRKQKKYDTNEDWDIVILPESKIIQ